MQIIKLAEESFVKHTIDQNLRGMFVKAFTRIYAEIEKDNSRHEGAEMNPQKIADEDSLLIIKYYQKSLQNGHSELFAKIFSRHRLIADDDNEAKDLVYNQYRKKLGKVRYDHTSAPIYREAFAECQSQGMKKEYSEIYAECVDNGERTDQAMSKAKNYQEAYDRCIEENRTKIYAKVYAHALKSGYVKLFAEKKAEFYEQETLSGKKPEYAEIFSDTFAELFTEARARGLIDAEDEKNVNYYRLKARIYAHLAVEEKIHDEKVLKNYETEYFNHIGEFGSDTVFKPLEKPSSLQGR